MSKRAHAGKGTGPKNGGSYAAKARAAWGANPPDWIAVLAHAADGRLSLNALGERLGISGGAISAVIDRKYPATYARIEARVKGALMSLTVACPVEGEIPRNRCADNQRRKPSAASPAAAHFPFACRTCPNAFASSSEAVGAKRTNSRENENAD